MAERRAQKMTNTRCCPKASSLQYQIERWIREIPQQEHPQLLYFHQGSREGKERSSPELADPAHT
jgi:hypothetical protein